VVVTINITNPSDGATVNTAVVTFSYNITDPDNPFGARPLLGIANIEYSLDGTHFISVKQGEDNKNIAQSDFFPLSSTFNVIFTQGFYTIYFRTIDCINNIGSETVWHLNIDISTNIAFNPVPPSLTNNSSLLVTGTVEAGDTVTVQVNSISFPVTLPTSSTWQSNVVLQEGSNTIIATGEDPSFNIATVTAIVVLDTLVPGAPVVKQILPAEPTYYNDGSPNVFTNQPNETLVGDKEGDTAIWINDVEVLPSDPNDTFSIPITLAEGANQLRLKTKDLAGNFSAEIIVNIFVDTVPPVNPGIVINDDVAFTLRRNVTLRLTAIDATAVKVSENPSFPNTDYIPFPSSPLLLPFELSRGGGLKTVYAVFKDAVGNETATVFDSIELPSTFSDEVSRVDTITVQALDVIPSDVEYLIRLQDNRDGTFSITFYLTLLDALNQVNIIAQVLPLPTVPGQQTSTVVPIGSGPSGIITSTLFVGAEMIIYRFRTDAYKADSGESTLPIAYTIRDAGDAFLAQTTVPIYEGSAFGRILEANVGGDPKKVRISKSFGLYDANTAIVSGTDAYPIIDIDGDQYPIAGAKFDYPLLTIPVEVVDIVEEVNDFLITLDTPLPRFDATFGYEMQFSKRQDVVNDYRITKKGRVEFLDESGVASGNVRIIYTTPQQIYSIPSLEFKAILAATGSSVKLVVQPTNNHILLSDLSKVCVRFFHSLTDGNYAAPTSIEVIVNDIHTAHTTAYVVVNRNVRVQIREFCIGLVELFPGGIPDTYGPNDPVLDKVEIAFTPVANVTYVDEIEVIAQSSVISSNCRVVVNGMQKFFSNDPVTRHFDTYELRVQDGHVDVMYNDKLVHSESVTMGPTIASFGAGARTTNDVLNSTFREFTTIRYIDTSPTTLILNGRYSEIEATLRAASLPLLRSFEVDFDSAISEYPSRLYTPNLFTDVFNDMATVAIIGTGRREEILMSQGTGLEDEGEPVDFNPANQPDGRHFKVVSFPIVTGTLEVTLVHEGIEMQLIENLNYQVDLVYGYIVLFHPIALGDRLSVVYTSLADTNAPELFTNIKQLIVKFGTPSLQNTLSLGAQLAFENGAVRILAIQALDPAFDPNWTNAYKSLAKEEAYFVVPLPPDDYPLIAVEGLSHVETQSATRNRHERVLILGETPDLTEGDLSSFRESFRVTFVEPNPIRRVVSDETEILQGMFLAAAYAGKFSSLQYMADPMTHKTLSGFDITSQPKLTNVDLQQKIDNGITYIKALPSGGQVCRGITTTNSRLAVEEEPSIVRIRDFLAVNIRRVLEDQYVGQPIVDDITKSIENTTTLFLNARKDGRLISVFQNVRAAIDSVEPRQVNVSFDVQPVFPLNTIVIRVNVVASL
jgi:hypothetical protein